MVARVLMFLVLSFLFVKFILPPLLGMALAAYAGFMLMVAGASLVFHATFWLVAAAVVGVIGFKVLGAGKKR